MKTSSSGPSERKRNHHLFTDSFQPEINQCSNSFKPPKHCNFSEAYSIVFRHYFCTSELTCFNLKTRERETQELNLEEFQFRKFVITKNHWWEWA